MTWTLEDAQQFEQGLRRQEGLYAALLECTRKQARELPEAGEPASLSRMLAEKQQWMDGIESVEAELLPRKQDWPMGRETLPRAMVDAIEQRLQSLHGILKSLIEAEESAARIMRERLDTGRGTLGAISRRHSAARAYGTPSRAGSRFVDNHK